jgi:hypothetical protein
MWLTLHDMQPIIKEEISQESLNLGYFGRLPNIVLPQMADSNIIGLGFPRESIHAQFGGSRQDTFTRLDIDGQRREVVFVTQEMNPSLPIDTAKHGTMAGFAGYLGVEQRFSLIIREPRLKKSGQTSWLYTGEYRVHDEQSMPVSMWKKSSKGVSSSE